jgi:hypothetical protein
MADVKISARVNHVTDFTNKPRFPVADDPTGTPVSGYMDTDDISAIADASAAAAIAALTIGNVSSSGEVSAGNMAVWIDADTIEDGGAIPDISLLVTGDASVTPGNIAVFDADGYHIVDGGAAPNVAGKRTIRTITAADTAETTDDLVVCNKATAMVFTLLEATGSGAPITVCSINTGVITIDVTAGGTIDGGLTKTLNQWNSVDLVDISAGMWKIV